jgi:uncharacterized protein (DUF697 family)
MDSKLRTTSAHFIIHSVAASAAAFSFAFSWEPGIGPTLGDTTVLTSLTIAMAMMIGDLFDKKILVNSAWSLGSVAVSYALGITLLKAGLSFVPFAGPFINASITAGLHEAIGWGLFRIFEQGLDPTTMSSDELKQAFIEGGHIAENFRHKSKEMDLIKKHMSEQDKEAEKELEHTIGSKETSEEKRIEAVMRMAQLYKKYGYDLSL